MLLLCILHVTSGKTWISLRQSSTKAQAKMKELKMPPKKSESAHLPKPMRSSITQTSGIVTTSGHRIVQEPVQVQNSEPVNSQNGGNQIVQQLEVNGGSNNDTADDAAADTNPCPYVVTNGNVNGVWSCGSGTRPCSANAVAGWDDLCPATEEECTQHCWSGSCRECVCQDGLVPDPTNTGDRLECIQPDDAADEINGDSDDDGPSSNIPYLTPMETIFIAAGSLLLFVVCAWGYLLKKEDQDNNNGDNGSSAAATETSSLLLNNQEYETTKILF